MPRKKKQITREEAQALASGWLAERRPAAIVLPEVEVRAYRSTWRARIWLDGLGEGEPDHYLVVSADGQIEEQSADKGARWRAKHSTGNPRGRPKELPEGLDRRPQIAFTPADEDRAEVERLAEVHGESVSSVVAQLLARALRGVTPSWEG